MSLAQLDDVEANLRRLRQRNPRPGLPLTETLILRAAIILGRDVNALLDRLLKPSGLAEPEFRLLMSLLAHGGSASAGDLCAALAQSPANLTRIADALVQRGYVIRDQDENDRRRVLLNLQPQGEQLLRGLLPGVSGEVAALFDDCSQADKQQMLAMLKRLLALIDTRGSRDAAPGEALA